MTWLVLAAALEVGLLPMGDFLMYDPPSTVSITGTIYTELEARATAWGVLFVGGEVRTFAWAVDGSYSFTPFRLLYQFEAGFTLGPLEIGFRHYCTHPQWVYLWAYRYGDAIYGQQARWEGAYEEVYLRLETPR